LLAKERAKANFFDDPGSGIVGDNRDIPGHVERSEANVHEANVRAGNQPVPPVPFTASLPRGEWPRAATDLPLILTQLDLAHLRGVTVRTLQRERRLGRLPIPHIKDGRKVLYARADVLAHYGARAA
jgi:hypothetical protein